MSRKRPRSVSPSNLTPADVYHSQPIHDRSSTFIAAYSPTLSAGTLQNLKEFKDASHKIAAWRRKSQQQSLSQRPIFSLGHDDDGEQYAGKKLERILAERKVEGSIVVARWYGGVLLGPVRFTHIENCAGEAINKWRETKDWEAKPRKTEAEEGTDRAALIASLQQRDQNIVVLRQLLAEKRAQGGAALTSPSAASPAKQICYDTMPLKVLTHLDKARDNTIAFVLKELDTIERMQKTPGVSDGRLVRQNDTNSCLDPS